jgi:hypothetical protein
VVSVTVLASARSDRDSPIYILNGSTHWLDFCSVPDDKIIMKTMMAIPIEIACILQYSLLHPGLSFPPQWYARRRLYYSRYRIKNKI